MLVKEPINVNFWFTLYFTEVIQHIFKGKFDVLLYT